MQQSKDTSQGSTELFIKPEFPSIPDDDNNSAEKKVSLAKNLEMNAEMI